ncbi:MAG: hypothetical protein HY581_10060, partial [Nitrospirae bacterium]|nr:hypothetical protein [Nitrospirota bacterium]
MFKHRLLIGIAVAGLAVLTWGSGARALDVADMTPEWTPDGKKIAAERAKLPAKDEMVRVPAGYFLMGSVKQVDRNAYMP